MCQDPPTYYHATAAPVAFDSAWARRAETVIVGGGLAGLTIAERLAAAGREAVVIERDRVGFGASGRNGGFVTPGFAQSMSAIERRVGLADAKTLHALSVAGCQYVETVAGSEARIIEGRGKLKLARAGDGSDLQRAAEEMDRKFGARSEFVDRQALSAWLSSDRYTAAIHMPDDAFHIQPVAYARALARRAVGSGARIIETCGARGLERIDGIWRLSTDKGIVDARQVVLCGSAYQKGLWRPLERAILPVATYVAISEPNPRQLVRAIRFAGAMADTRRAGDYYRLIGREDERRLLWGGRITTRTSLPPRLLSALRADIVGVYPQFGSLTLEGAWLGLMGYTRTLMPIVGEIDDGLWAATAFGGHGLNTTAAAGNLIASALIGGDDRWRLFAPFHVWWGGGWPGRMAAQTAYWFMQARDRWDERPWR